MHPFTIDKAYAETLRNKMEVFKTETGTRKAIYLTLITTFGLAKTPYTSIIQNALTMEALFD